MENATPQTFRNSQITCTVNTKPNCLLEIEVKALKPLVTPCYEKALQAVSKQVSIPGFRKGKAPTVFISQKFSKEVRADWQECIVREALKELYALTKVEPINKNNVRYSVKDLSEEEANLIFFLEVAPVIPKVDPMEFKLQEVKAPVVDDEKIQETIRQALFFYATWNPIEGRPVQEGDFLMLDIDLLDTTPPSSLFRNTRFEVADKSMAQWMKTLLIGKNVGDEVEGVSVPDEDADPKDKEELKPKKVKITIKAIEESVLPEMTPELFKNLGVESEEDLRNKVEGLLKKQSEDHVKEEKRSQVREFLLSTYPFDLPETLITNEVQFRVNQLNRNEEFLGYWRSLNKEEQQNVIQTIRTQSEKAVRLYHLSSQIVKEHKLSPSVHDLPKPPETQIEALVNPNQMLHYHHQPEIKNSEAMSRLVLDQAEDYIIAQASANVVA